jgi:hypothetical protein
MIIFSQFHVKMPIFKCHFGQKSCENVNTLTPEADFCNREHECGHFVSADVGRERFHHQDHLRVPELGQTQRDGSVPVESPSKSHASGLPSRRQPESTKSAAGT